LFVSALIAFLFPDKKEVVFANYHTWKAIGFTMPFVYGNILCVSTKLLIAIILLIVAMISYLVVEIRVKPAKPCNEIITDEENKLNPDNNTANC
jgi:hypothetical protein